MHIIPEGEKCIFPPSQTALCLPPTVLALISTFTSHNTFFQQSEASRFSKNSLGSFVVYLTKKKKKKDKAFSNRIQIETHIKEEKKTLYLYFSQLS